MADSGLRKSIEDVQRSVQIPTASSLRRLFAFIGPAYMVSVGYMDPGNWATDIEGGARFGYALIWVLMMSNLMALLLQTLSARLGLVTGRDLAQACREEYPQFVRWVLFLLCEIAIAAMDLAELLGSAVGLNLLFGIDILWAVLITGFDVMLLLLIQRAGIRKMEAFIVMLVATIGLCFIVEIFLSKPAIAGIASGFVPHLLSGRELYIAIAIIGATVMPHNLYLHSSLVQSRDVVRSRGSVAQACKYNLIDSIVAMNGAFFINAAILIVAAAVFHRAGEVVSELQQASHLLERLLGTKVAPVAFAIALLAAGQSSTVTGTLAGQITMEGFLNFRMRPWLRRMVTRTAALLPAVAVILISRARAGNAEGGENAIFSLLILSQVVLSLQLPFAVVPLVKFTGSRQKMGPFVSRRWLKVLAWVVTAILVVLNAKLVYEQIAGWASIPNFGPLVVALAGPMSVGLFVLLLWMIARRDRAVPILTPTSAERIASQVSKQVKRFRRIGVALEAKDTDVAMLSQALTLARSHQAQLVLMHIVEGVGGQWYGAQTGDLESRQDEEYIHSLAERLTKELEPQGLPPVLGVLGYGDVPRGLIRLAENEKLDLLVVGGHGHHRLADVFRGSTIPGVRHGLDIPVFSVRGRSTEPVPS